jgi:hypothetical protein
MGSVLGQIGTTGQWVTHPYYCQRVGSEESSQIVSGNGSLESNIIKFYSKSAVRVLLQIGKH